MKKIISVVGARPNFMKIAPIHKAFQKYTDTFTHLICHTGQHYDSAMSKVFFDELELPLPDFYLGVGSCSHAEQTARIMVEFEKILIRELPDLIIVVGDVNSTLACSLTAVKLGIRVAHVEAGLRSFDRGMPEEINRIVTDAVSDLLFVSEPSGMLNLKNEGVNPNKMFFVGNCMIDSLVGYRAKIDQSTVFGNLAASNKNYILTTFHRPSNVDDEGKLSEIVDFLNELSLQRLVIFPIHPRTRQKLIDFNLITKLSNAVKLIDPLGYLDFMALVQKAELIITDSGGIQEESTFLGVQCITVRTSTERPVTVELGTNQLAGINIAEVKMIARQVLDGKVKKGTIPELWDGKSANRILSHLYDYLVISSNS